MPQCEFWVSGDPRPQGSKRHIGHGRMIEVSKGLKSWRQAISDLAGIQSVSFKVPVVVELGFYLRRPQSHYNAQGLKPTAPSIPIVKRNDIDKLCRAVLDGITGKLLLDDSLVTELHANRWYAVEEPGCKIFIRTFELAKPNRR